MTTETVQNRILVVDDDVDILLMLTILLRNAGYAVEGTLNGTETLSRTARFKPDLIIMDIFLTGTNGKDICKTLKNSEGTSHIPVLLISSDHQPESILDYGADDFIDKPFKIDFLLEKVMNYISRSKQTVRIN